MRFAFAVYLVCSAFAGWTVYMAMGILEQVE